MPTASSSTRNGRRILPINFGSQPARRATSRTGSATSAAITTAASRLDSVANAIATPEKEQPYAALGLKSDEYQSIRDILGRRPTSGELAMYSVMWSEHC